MGWMEILVALLCVAIEKVMEPLLGRLGGMIAKHLPSWGTKDVTKRRAVFDRAARNAIRETIRYAPNRREVERILQGLFSKKDQQTERLIAELVNQLISRRSPDLPYLIKLCQEQLGYDAAELDRDKPSSEAVAQVLADFVTNLREGLQSDEAYRELFQPDTREKILDATRDQGTRPPVDEDTYRYQLFEAYRQLDFVGIPEVKERQPITLEDIFIHLHAQYAGDSQAEQKLPEADLSLEDQGERDAMRLREARDLPSGAATLQLRASIEEILRTARSMVILGHPGTGKTTLLKYLVVLCAGPRSDTNLELKAEDGGVPLPVFLPLREFAAECARRGQACSLLEYFYTHAREHLLLDLPQGFFEDALQAGRCLLCLDGLDEVWAVGQRKAVTDAVHAIASRYPRNRYLVTSRIVGYEEAPLDHRQFTHYTVLPLEMGEIREFVRKWYAVRERDLKERERQTRDLLDTIERTPSLQSLARTPLLLTIIALVHRTAKLPDRRVELYDKCITTLVVTWDDARHITIEDKQRLFYSKRQRLLERLAYELHTRAARPGQLQPIKAGELEFLLTRFLQEDPNLDLANDPDTARDEARALIRLVRGRTGLLIERGDGVYTFPHLTFQEYLAACDMERRCLWEGRDVLWKEVKERLHDSHWREVLLLLIGILSRVEGPPTFFVGRILEAGREDPLEEVLHRHLYLAARVLADRIEVAADLHQRIVADLLTIVRSRPLWESQDAIPALSQLSQDRYAARGLLELAQSDMALWVRRQAAEALGQLGWGDGDVLACLRALAGDLKIGVGIRYEAAQSLARLGCAGDAGEVLLDLASDEKVDPQVRCQAAEAVGMLCRGEEKEKMCNGLWKLAQNEVADPRVRRVAAEALWQLEDMEGAVRCLVELAQDREVDPRVRREAAEALGRLGYIEDAADTFEVLARSEHVDLLIRGQAVQDLARLVQARPRALERLVVLASDDRLEPRIRGEAVQALGRVGRNDAKVKGRIARMAEGIDIEPLLRCEAAETLGSLGDKEDASKTLLAIALNGQIPNSTRRVAAEALGRIKPDSDAGGILMGLATQGPADPWGQRAAIRGLGRFGSSVRQALPGFRVLSSSERAQPWEREKARRATASLEGRLRQVRDDLLSLGEDQRLKVDLRASAGMALWEAGFPEEAASILLPLARDQGPELRVRRDAVEALGKTRSTSKEVADTLLALAQNDHKNPDVTRVAAEALGHLGRAYEHILDGLLALAKDEDVDMETQENAYASLKRLVGGAEGALRA